MIKDLNPGDSVTEFYIVRNKEIREKKKEKGFYLSLELGDASGRIFGSLWEGVESANELLKIGQPAKVQASVINWKGRPHLSVHKIRPAGARDNLDLNDFIPQGTVDINQQLEKLDKFIQDIKVEELGLLLKNIYENQKVRQRLVHSAGGKLWHHCYEGGLLEHTLGVATVVKKLTDIYPKLKCDLLITAALLHDVGKLFEYENRGFIDFTDRGRLHGHIVLGFNLIEKEIDKIDDFNALLKNELLHLVLSHQGDRANGSPVPPMTREAFVLYFADEIDSKLGAIERIEDKEKLPGKTWSNYVKLLDRFIYFGENIPGEKL